MWALQVLGKEVDAYKCHFAPGPCFWEHLLDGLNFKYQFYKIERMCCWEEKHKVEGEWGKDEVSNSFLLLPILCTSFLCDIFSFVASVFKCEISWYYIQLERNSYCPLVVVRSKCFKWKVKSLGKSLLSSVSAAIKKVLEQKRQCWASVFPYSLKLHNTHCCYAFYFQLYAPLYFFSFAEPSSRTLIWPQKVTRTKQFLHLTYTSKDINNSMSLGLCAFLSNYTY